jgi:histidinol-phosphatase
VIAEQRESHDNFLAQYRTILVVEIVMEPDWRNRYDVAITAAHAAGRHAMHYFEWKQDRSPVTIADREAESMLRTQIHAAFPDDGFLGEEFGEQAGSSGYRWIIDPIDGTKSFIRNIPLWATLVGLEYLGEQIAGVAYLPALGDVTYRALRGDGAWRDDRAIHVSGVETLAEAYLFYSSVGWFLHAGNERQFLNLVKQTQRQRGYGDFYGFLLVAQGSGDLMVEHGISPWDIAALKPIVEEAGGRMTNWLDIPTIACPDVIGSNGLVHKQALKILQAE